MAVCLLYIFYIIYCCFSTIFLQKYNGKNVVDDVEYEVKEDDDKDED
jgi:hypothetical protein